MDLLVDKLEETCRKMEAPWRLHDGRFNARGQKWQLHVATVATCQEQSALFEIERSMWGRYL